MGDSGVLRPRDAVHGDHRVLEGGPYLDYEFPAAAEIYGGKKFRVPDVFDPQWVADCGAKAKLLCTPRRDSRQLVGYFTDNEISFGDRGYVLLDICRKGNPNMPVTKAARAFTGTPQEWVKVFASRYFQTAHDLIRKYDSNHLILGCRFGGPPGPEVFAAITPWTDVVSANNYRMAFHEMMDQYYKATGKPILNGEFNWWSDRFRGRNQFQKGEAALRKVFTHPGVVGYTWYRWNHEKGGLVDHADNPHEENIAVLKKLNAEAETIRHAAVGR